MDQVDISLLKLQADMEEQLTKNIGQRDVAQKEKKDADYVVMQKTARLSEMMSNTGATWHRGDNTVGNNRFEDDVHVIGMELNMHEGTLHFFCC
ncbi:MAG: hypothetical protein EZS28_055728, partial [Streblomastix strix]